MGQLGKLSPTTVVKAFAKDASSGGGCARAASGGPAKKRAVSFLAVHALGPRNEDRLSRAVIVINSNAKVLRYFARANDCCWHVCTKDGRFANGFTPIADKRSTTVLTHKRHFHLRISS
jgi:hypothetical protein